MVSIEDLKKVLMFRDMTDQMLRKMLPITQLCLFKEREVIYEPGKDAENFYMLKRGKVLLQERVSESIIISFGSIKPGYSFGWPSMIPDGVYCSYAVPAEPSEVLVIQRDKLLALLDHDKSLGYLFVKSMFRILVKRLEYRNAQLLRVITRHPDFIKFLDK